MATSALRKELAGRKVQSGTVRDIVDPSLFPFVFEKTKVLRYGATALSDCILRCGEGQAVPSPPEGDTRQSDPIKYPNDKAWSRRFQWLPFDVHFEHNGQGASRYVSVCKPTRPQAELMFRLPASKATSTTCIPTTIALSTASQKLSSTPSSPSSTAPSSTSKHPAIETSAST